MKKNCIVWMLLLPLLIGCGRKTGGQEEAPAPLMLTDSLRQVVSVETVREDAPEQRVAVERACRLRSGAAGPGVYPIFGGTVTQVEVEMPATM